MRIISVITIVAMAGAAAVAQKPGSREVGWGEEFDTAQRWYPVAYTHNSARHFSLNVADGVGHFHVAEPGTAMRWMTTPGGVNLQTYSILELRYRAEGQVDEGDGYFLYMRCNPTARRPEQPPVTLGELQADGKWHTLRKPMPRKDDHDVWATKFVLSVNATDRPADVWIDHIRLVAPEPEPLPEPPEGPGVAVRHDFDDLRGWEELPDVAYRGSARMSCRDGAAEFEVEGMQRNASFVWRLPRPVDAKRFSHVAFRYRIRGPRLIYTRNPRALGYFMTVGASEHEEPIYLWNSLINDGAWHVADNAFPTGRFPDGVEYVRVNLVSEESPGAWAELDWLCLADGPQRVGLGDLFEVVESPSAPSGSRFEYADIQATAGASAGELVRRYSHVARPLPQGQLGLDGVPFRLSDEAHVLGVAERDELTIPAGGRLSAVYALIATRPEGCDSFTYWGGPIRAVREPERFVVRLRYADGSSFASVPVNIRGRSFVMPPGPGVFGVVNPHPEREVESVSLVDGTRAVGFHVLGVTLQRAGEPLFETPQAGRPLPPPSRVTDKAPGEATEIEVGEESVTLRSDYLALELDLSEGIRAASMFSGILEQRLLPRAELFSLETEGGALSSDDVDVTGVEQTSPTQLCIDFAADEPTPMQGRVTLRWNAASEIGMTVGITNGGEGPLRGALTVTPLPGAAIDTVPENVWVFYPGFGTLITNEPFFEDSVKSDHLPLGFVTAWSPQKAGGLYVMGHDTVPQRDTHYVLEKYLGRVTASVRYLYLDAAPGATADMPEVAVGAYLGDWRNALAAYREWMDTWYSPTASHPEWFRRICTFVGITPTLSSFLDEDRRMDLSPHIEAMAEHLGQIDYLHIYGWFHSREHGGQGDYSHYELLGGEEAWRGALQRLENSGVRTGLYLDPLLMDERAQAAERAAGWKIIGEDGEVRGWSPGNFYTCPALPDCRRYWAETYERVARSFRPSGLYMDQVGYWNPESWVCYNPEHDHKTPPIGMRVSQAPLVQQLRHAINGVDDRMASYSEFVPTEIMTQWQDGAFTHNQRFEWERPHTFLVNPIYWAVPEVKCFEIYAGNDNVVWENVRLPLRLFWGRETLYMAGEPTEYAPETAAAIRRIGQIWHDYAAAFATTRPRFLVRTLHRGVYANRFPAEGYEVYTLFNDLPYTAEGELIDIEHRPGNSYIEVWQNEALAPALDGDRARISLTVPPKKVRVVVALGEWMRLGR
ncbi:MAG: DUF6259 domain-containing protein [Armatimonadota bacterium]|nr:DUF6259 domain-containing protein [Armatimonadota bacterium]